MEFIDKLHSLANEQLSLNITELFSKNSQRYDELSFSTAHLAIDYSKQNFVQATKDSLLGWANESRLDAAIKAMFSGDEINHTEKRKVLHSILRAPQ